MISFNYIEIEGFGPYLEKTRYYLNKNGVNLISGDNGAGKTQWVSAITWALYKNTLKGKSSINTWEHLQPKDYQGTKVLISYNSGDKEYKVIRCKNFKGKIEGIRGASKVFIYINDKYQDHLRDVADADNKIVESIGMSFKLFKNSIVFAQKLTRLLSESGTEQKKIFDEAFATEFINEGRKKAQDKLSSLEEELKELSRDKANLIDLVTQRWESVEKLEGLMKNHELKKKERLKKLKSELKDLSKELKENKKLRENLKSLEDSLPKIKSKIKALEPKLEKFNELDNKKFKLEFTIAQDLGSINDYKAKIKKLGIKVTTGSKRCPYCDSILNKEKAKKQKSLNKADLDLAKLELSYLQDDVIVKQSELKSIESSLKELTGYKDDMKELKKSLDLKQLELNSTNKPRKEEDIKKDRKRLKKEIELEEANELDIDIDKEKAAALDREDEVKVLEKKMKPIEKNVEVHKWIISDALSNKGLKAYIFKNMIDNVNVKLARFTPYLSFKVRFEIDLNSATKAFGGVIYKHNGVVDYEDLSGGEKQLTDLALAFSINESIVELNPVNLLVLDEVFESLDEKNIGIVSDIISSMAENRSLHIITHRKEFSSSRIVKSVKVKSSKGISSLV